MNEREQWEEEKISSHPALMSMYCRPKMHIFEFHLFLKPCAVEQQLLLSPHNKKVTRQVSVGDMHVWSLYVLLVHVWVSSRSYSFLSSNKSQHANLRRVSTLALKWTGNLSKVDLASNSKVGNIFFQKATSKQWKAITRPHRETKSLFFLL